MSLNFFVPPLGTRVILAQPWAFKLYNERRNATLMALLGDTRETSYTPVAIDAELPQGAELIIDRYYIRQGLGDFDSVSFRIVGAKASAKVYAFSTATTRQVRFWAKLEDVNTMVVDVVPAAPTPEY